MRKFVLLSFIFWANWTSGVAQELPAIQTDRPDQTECPFIVPKGYIQVENGFNIEKTRFSETSTFVTSTLLKYGINEKFELRFITELETAKNFSFLNPIMIGFKTVLSEEKGILPKTSFIGHLGLPKNATPKNELQKPTPFAPNFRFTMQHTLHENVSLSYNLGTEWDGINTEPTFIYTLATGIGLSDKIGTYIEVFGFLHSKNGNQHNADGGFTYHITNDIMLDISGGIELTKPQPSSYVSLGFSARIPSK